MVKHYSVTLTSGTPVQLSSVLSGAHDHQYAAIWMQPRASNLNPVYVGSDNTITSTNYGMRLEAPVSSIPQAPFNPGEFSIGGGGYGQKSPTKLSDFWLLGTTGDFVQLLVLWY